MSGGRAYGKVARHFLPFHGGIFQLHPMHHSSISPGGLAAVFAALAAITLGIGIGFAAHGAWLVLPFAGAEALVLVIAFFVTARRMADYEGKEQ